MTEPTNQPAAELPDDTHPFLLPCPLNHYVSAGLRVRKDNPRVICLDCGLSMEATDFPTLYERWNARHQPPAIPLDAREIVGTVFDNTDASHETLKETVIDRIAAALTTTPAASGPLSNQEPHAYQEHPRYPNYCQFAGKGEDYCKREADAEIHNTNAATGAQTCVIEGPSSTEYYKWLETYPSLQHRLGTAEFSKGDGYEIWRNSWLQCRSLAQSIAAAITATNKD